MEISQPKFARKARVRRAQTGREIGTEAKCRGGCVTKARQILVCRPRVVRFRDGRPRDDRAIAFGRG